MWNPHDVPSWMRWSCLEQVLLVEKHTTNTSQLNFSLRGWCVCAARFAHQVPNFCTHCHRRTDHTDLEPWILQFLYYFFIFTFTYSRVESQSSVELRLRCKQLITMAFKRRQTDVPVVVSIRLCNPGITSGIGCDHNNLSTYWRAPNRNWWSLFAGSVGGGENNFRRWWLYRGVLRNAIKSTLPVLV